MAIGKTICCASSNCQDCLYAPPQLESGLGQTRSSERFRYMSAQAPQAELQAARCDVAVVPTTDIALVDAAVCARSRRGGARQSRDASRHHAGAGASDQVA